jgi:hypothetical protein
MGGGNSKPRVFNITINVYDLTSNELNGAITSIIGGGIHHSGIQINSTEYAFGGGGSGTGVWEQRPREIPENFGGESGSVPSFSRSHEIGTVTMTKKQLKGLLSNLRKEYPSSRYHLLNCNCNHFTADVCKRLGLTAPEYLNKAANVGSSIMNFGMGLMNAFGNMLEEQQHRNNNGNRLNGESSNNNGGPDIQIVD